MSRCFDAVAEGSVTLTACVEVIGELLDTAGAARVDSIARPIARCQARCSGSSSFREDALPRQRMPERERAARVGLDDELRLDR